MIKFIYQVSAIDWFSGWNKVYLYENENDFGSTGKHLSIPLEIFQIFMEAFDKIRSVESYWEGDVRECEMYWSGLPPFQINEATCNQYIIAWKQDNNGNTFIASPFQIPGYSEGEIYNSKKVKENHG